MEIEVRSQKPEVRIKTRSLYLLAVLMLALLGFGASTAINLSDTNRTSGLLPVARGGTGVATATANTVFMGPASGSAAAPSFRIPSPSEFGALPDASSLRITYGFSTGTGVSDYADAFAGAGTVTHAVATSTLPSYTQAATTATNGNVSSLSGNLNYVVGLTPGMRIIALTSQSSIGAQRMWRGVTDQTAATMAASDDPAGNYAAVAYCNDGAAADCATDDTNYRFKTKNAVTQTNTDTGLAADTNFHQWWIIETPGVNFALYECVTLPCPPNALTLRATNTTNLPTTGTPLRYFESATCRTCTPTVQNLRRARTQIETAR